MTTARLRSIIGFVVVCACLAGQAEPALSGSRGAGPGVADSALKGVIFSWATRLQQDAASVELHCAVCLQTGGRGIVADAVQATRAIQKARPAAKTGRQARAVALQAFGGFAAMGRQLVQSGQAAAQAATLAGVGQARQASHFAELAARTLAQARVAGQSAGARVVNADHLIPAARFVPPYHLQILSIRSATPAIYTGDALTVTYRLANDWDQVLNGGRTAVDLDGAPIEPAEGTFASDVPLPAKTAQTFQIALSPYDNDKPGPRTLTVSFWQVSLVTAPPTQATVAGFISFATEKRLIASNSKKFVAAEGALLATEAAVPTAPVGPFRCAGRPFPQLDGGLPRYEWAPVIPGGYETTVSGTALLPHLRAVRLPFAHPFGITPGTPPAGHPRLFDSVFSLAVGPRYSALLDAGNVNPTDGELAQARRGAPSSAGVMPVGSDQNLFPRAYRPQNGDDVVLLGDWVVDCARSDFPTEIRPPLLMVSARSQGSGGGATGPGTTVSSIVGRPYYVDQEYREGDEVSRHGLMAHLRDEWDHWAKTVLRSKIAALAHLGSKPFVGKRTLRYYVSPSTHRQSSADKLVVRYDLAVRGGVTVRVSVPANNPDHAEIYVQLNESAYQAPPLPKPHECAYNLKALGFDPVILKLTLIHLFALVGVPSSFLVGTLLDVDASATCFDPLPSPPLTLPTAQDIRVDDGQPYPIYGVVTAKWQRGGVPAVTKTPPPPAVSVGEVSVVEGNAGLTVARVPVSLSAAPSAPVSVSWATRDGSAKAGSDYAAASGTVTFPAGVASQVVTVSVVGDTIVEPDESFAIDLSRPVAATLAKGTGTVTIVNDDAPATPAPPPPPAVVTPSLSIDDVSLAEGDSGTTDAVFTVQLSQASSQAVSVDYRSEDGSARDGSDYSPRSGRLVIPIGSTKAQVRVPVNGDTTAEPDETFVVVLENPSNASIARAIGTATILNDDSPPAPAGKSDLTVTAIANASGEVLTSCTVRFTIKNIGTAAAGSSVTNVHGHMGIAGNWHTNVPTPPLAPGESVELTGTIDHGCHNTDITVTADTTAVIDESDEDNNVLGGTF